MPLMNLGPINLLRHVLMSRARNATDLANKGGRDAGTMVADKGRSVSACILVSTAPGAKRFRYPLGPGAEGDAPHLGKQGCFSRQGTLLVVAADLLVL